ncbi:MAG: ribosomal-protein-alanine N-acetyltransferase [Rhodoferax sp.]|nr:ribosomal-protein-alanine N-acetyltransferase [Rhodoferax sp.]
MTVDLLDEVLRVERLAYAHPWSRGNFEDTLRTGYEAQVLRGGDTLLGYFVAMLGVEEVHLLNITVAPAWQRRGWARLMLQALAVWSRGQGATRLWLEVRAGNQRAMDVYRAHGFRPVGRRKGYYPDRPGQREDAIVMSLDL